MKAISNKNLVKIQYETAPFEGKWLASFGRPELSGAWIIYGGSGSGKTHFALELAKYLSNFVEKIAYNTFEQRRGNQVRGSFQESWIDCKMEEIGTKIITIPGEKISELRVRLAKRKSPKVIFLDSISAIFDFRKEDFLELIDDFPSKLFIFLAHEENRRPYPRVADYVRKLSEVKIHVKGYQAHVTTRFRGGDGSKFVIWEQGANEYNASQKL